jgi:hypothetical protein
MSIDPKGIKLPSESDPRPQRSILIYDQCTCGRRLFSILEATRGICASCFVKGMPSDTQKALKKMILSALKPTSEAERTQLFQDALEKIKRDENERGKAT